MTFTPVPPSSSRGSPSQTGSTSSSARRRRERSRPPPGRFASTTFRRCATTTWAASPTSRPSGVRSGSPCRRWQARRACASCAAHRGAPDPGGVVPRHPRRHGARAQRDRLAQPHPDGGLRERPVPASPGAPRQGPRPYDAGAEGRGASRAAGARAAANGRSAAQSIRRRLRASARGRFRTRGRHSAATVRGTVWLTADRCDGTLTPGDPRPSGGARLPAARGRSSLRAGKSYLAQPRR